MSTYNDDPNITPILWVIVFAAIMAGVSGACDRIEEKRAQKSEQQN